MATLGQATRFGSGSMASSVQEIGAALARQAEATGERLQSLATAFREALPADGAAALVSEGIESAGSYLGERDFRNLGRDVVDLVRRYPLQAMLLGAGFGYVLSRWAGRRPPEPLANGRLADVMTPNVEVVGPDATLEEAAAKMADIEVGVIPVCDGQRLVGMLTDRDITIRAVARGAAPSTPVREIMSTTVRWAYEDEPVEKAREAMKRHRIRRLPVLDRNKRLAGIVSLGDLAVESEMEEAGEVLEQLSAARPTH